jgi:hypothetical protein
MRYAAPPGRRRTLRDRDMPAAISRSEPMSESTSEVCGTCYGEGATPSEHGQLTCVDCAGTGRLPSGLVRTEWRLRELERIYAAGSGIGALGVGQGTAPEDVRWLVGEVRRAHHALLQILAVADDTDAVADPALTRIKFLSNAVLSMYPLKTE